MKRGSNQTMRSIRSFLSFVSSSRHVLRERGPVKSEASLFCSVSFFLFLSLSLLFRTAVSRNHGAQKDATESGEGPRRGRTTERSGNSILLSMLDRDDATSLETKEIFFCPLSVANLYPTLAGVSSSLRRSSASFRMINSRRG